MLILPQVPVRETRKKFQETCQNLYYTRFTVPVLSVIKYGVDDLVPVDPRKLHKSMPWIARSWTACQDI